MEREDRRVWEDQEEARRVAIHQWWDAEQEKRQRRQEEERETWQAQEEARREEDRRGWGTEKKRQKQHQQERPEWWQMEEEERRQRQQEEEEAWRVVEDARWREEHDLQSSAGTGRRGRRRHLPAGNFLSAAGVRRLRRDRPTTCRCTFDSLVAAPPSALARRVIHGAGIRASWYPGVGHIDTGSIPGVGRFPGRHRGSYFR